MQSFFNRPYVQFLIALSLLTFIIALGAYAQLTFKQAKMGMMGPTTISITGEAEIFAKPDIGQFSFSVNANGVDAAEAQTKSAEAVNAILAYLGEAGVAEKDIKTQGYNLAPRYRYEDRACAPGMFCNPGEPILDGYEVSQTISVKVRDLDKAGTLISEVGSKGATNLSGLEFTIDDESALKAEAQAEAIVDAKAKAQKIANNLEVRLGKVINFYEHEGTPMPYYGGAMMESAVAKDAMMAPSLPVGENTIRSVVTIVFELE